MNYGQMRSILGTGLTMFILAYGYAWSMGVIPPLLCAKLAVGALIPWAWGKVTDADKTVPSLDNVKALIGVKQP
ncbi:MAG: hypothetical protein WCI95_03205 [bacterium]